MYDREPVALERGRREDIEQRVGEGWQALPQVLAPKRRQAGLMRLAGKVEIAMGRVKRGRAERGRNAK